MLVCDSKVNEFLSNRRGRGLAMGISPCKVQVLSEAIVVWMLELAGGEPSVPSMATHFVCGGSSLGPD